MTEENAKMDVLDFEPEIQVETKDEHNDKDDGKTVGENVENMESAETVSRLRCNQCEFLKFKNIDQWKNHVVGHWRLSGMKTDFDVECLK